MSFKCTQRFAIKMVVERLVITACIYKGVRNKPCSTHRWWCSSDQPNLWGENVKRHVSQWLIYWLLYLFIYLLNTCMLFVFLSIYNIIFHLSNGHSWPFRIWLVYDARKYIVNYINIPCVHLFGIRSRYSLILVTIIDLIYKWNWNLKIHFHSVKGPYSGKWHIFVLAVLYLFECLIEWRQHSDR